MAVKELQSGELVVVADEIVQLSAFVCFGVRFQVTAKVKPTACTVAPSAGEGATNVIAGLPGFVAAEAKVVAKATTNATTTPRSSAFRVR